MAAQPCPGFEPHLDSSTVGIFYNDENQDPWFLKRAFTPNIYIPFQISDSDYNFPISFCSTSFGLIAVFDANKKLYLVGNPLVGKSSFLSLKPPAQSQHRPQDGTTHVVLGTQITSLELPIYHLICATLIDEKIGYRLDIYNSYDTAWQSHHGIKIPGGIAPQSGIYCESSVYWLTADKRPSVIQFSLGSAAKDLKFFPVPPASNSAAQFVNTSDIGFLKLGRIGNKVGLVIVDASSSKFNLWILNNTKTLRLSNDGRSYVAVNKEGSFDLHASLSFSINKNLTSPAMKAGVLNCTEMPRPIMFQGFKMEIYFWVDNRLVLWEENSVNKTFRRVIFIKDGVPIQISLGSSFTGSYLDPRHNFPIRLPVP